jgi:hypothetical protein
LGEDKKYIGKKNSFETAINKALERVVWEKRYPLPYLNITLGVILLLLQV